MTATPGTDPTSDGRNTGGLDNELVDALVRSRRFFTRNEVSPDLRTMHKKGGRAADDFYRDRWSHDKVVRSTHGVNCTGSCSARARLQRLARLPVAHQQRPSFLREAEA
jgi:hypothetical protein